MAKIKLVVSATIEETFSDFIISKKTKGLVRYNTARGVQRTSIHAFRHTFARKYLVDCGGDAFSLQRLIGHSTLKMTRHYCNLFNDDIIESHEQRSPLTHLTKSKRQTIKK